MAPADQYLNRNLQETFLNLCDKVSIKCQSNYHEQQRGKFK